MNKLFLLAITLISLSKLSAQQILLNGKITYERRYSVIKDLTQQAEEEGEENMWLEEMKKNMPKYKVDVFQLAFTPKKAVYKTIQEDEHPMLRWFKTITEVSQLTNFETDSFIANRLIYEKGFVIADSISKPEWKLTGEYREIAGYMCRRATTVIYDSLFVIAFYADAIPVSGGPDFFAGLPGMIMGVVIPRFNTTIFATKVETVIPVEEDLAFKPMRKVEKTSKEGYRKLLMSDTQRWGKYGNRLVLKAML